MAAEKKALLVVPHGDDELFVGGGLLKTLVQEKEYECYVVYTTNGDYFAHEAEERIRESQRVLTKIYGIKESNIFYLGYGDGWKSDVHLYNQDDFRVIESEAGRRETYAPPGYREYRMLKSGRHSTYCRDSFKHDLKELLGGIMADIILAVDYDKHPDHRAASLMTEECIGELLSEKTDYRPIVLKRYAYDGVWKGKADFFEIPRKRTVLSMAEHSPYVEEDRLSIAMPVECGAPYLKRNFLYRASKCYRTQEVWQKADEIINIDEVFWLRNTDNLLREAEVAASSGNAACLYDFKLFDCADVMRKEFVPGACGWLPDISDEEKKVRIHLACPREVAQINLYALGNADNSGNGILAGEFVFDGEEKVTIKDISLDGRKNRIVLDTVRTVRDIDFYLTECEGSPIGITEMEILPRRDGKVPEVLKDLVFDGDTLKYTPYNKCVVKVQKVCWLLQRKLWSWFPNRFFLRRQYPELAARPSRIWVYRAKYFWARVKKVLAIS